MRDIEAGALHRSLYVSLCRNTNAWKRSAVSRCDRSVPHDSPDIYFSHRYLGNWELLPKRCVPAPGSSGTRSSLVTSSQWEAAVT